MSEQTVEFLIGSLDGRLTLAVASEEDGVLQSFHLTPAQAKSLAARLWKAAHEQIYGEHQHLEAS